MAGRFGGFPQSVAVAFSLLSVKEAQTPLTNPCWNPQCAGRGGWDTTGLKLIPL